MKLLNNTGHDLEWSQTVNAQRVANLRLELAADQLEGFIVPRSDRYQNEYVAASDERLAWLTGFTGSAGLAVVLRDRAALFVDGRYIIQAEQQVDPSLFTVYLISTTAVEDWLSERSEVSRLGFDPWLHSVQWAEAMRETCRRLDIRLIATDTNPIDEIWRDRPPEPSCEPYMHPHKFAGEAHHEKRARIGGDIARSGANSALLSAPDSIAWLLNIRGDDIPHTPVALCMALLSSDGRCTLFMDPKRVTTALFEYLNGTTSGSVEILQPDAIGAELMRLGRRGEKLLFDPQINPDWIVSYAGSVGCHMIRGTDPCQLPKAIKNAQEIEGAIAAHRRDGAAMCRYLAFLDQEAGHTNLDEVTAADTLESIRRQDRYFRGHSFSTISAVGPNAALTHYQTRPETNRKLTAGEIYLCDSGAQYIDGTTDITRTIIVGDPTAEMCDRFTRVLKGHIAVATAQFAINCNGAQLDGFARRPLWAVGLDYDHGTGHGVGSYLGVHEGPARIAATGQHKLKPGMILSNEPGYYKQGAYGVRIENLELVQSVANDQQVERPMLKFHCLSLAPIDTKLIASELLTDDEIDWLNGYHARIYREIGPMLDPAEQSWLEQATAEFGR